MKNNDLFQEALMTITLQSKIARENHFNNEMSRKVAVKKEDFRKHVKAARKQKHK